MNEIIDEKKANDLLAEFGKFTFDVKNPTFLEIINQRNKENVWSRILAFYFDPNKNHGFKDLLLISFFEALGERDVCISNPKLVNVNIEFQTDNKNRIDIVIISNDFVIGIENKVDFGLNNDLEDYGNKIDKIAITKGLLTYKIILSKFPHSPQFGFVNLSYERFIRSIKNNLPHYCIDNKSNGYLTFLNDFINNIEKSINFKEMIENKEVLEYFQSNYEEIKSLSEKFQQLNGEVAKRFNEIWQSLNLNELDILLKNKIGNEASIEKAEIEDDAFWITIRNGVDSAEDGIDSVVIEFVCENVKSMSCYCSSGAAADPYKSKKYNLQLDIMLEANELKELPENMSISDDATTTSNKIYDYCSEIIDKVMIPISK